MRLKSPVLFLVKLMNYAEKIEEALVIQERYLSFFPQIVVKIGPFPSKYNPNLGVNASAKNFLYAGGKLAGQILKTTHTGYLQLAVVGLRTLFEMSVNAVYIFNHPKIGQKKRHMRKVCKEIIYLANKKRNVNHTRIDNKSFKQRLQEVGIGYLYNKNYRVMSDWAHLMSQTLYISTDQDKGQKFGVEIAKNCLYALHNIFDAISAYAKFELNPGLEKSVVSY